MDYVPHSGRRFAVSYEMKTNITWAYAASHFVSVEDARGYIIWIYFRFHPCKLKTTVANSCQKGHLFLYGRIH